MYTKTPENELFALLHKIVFATDRYANTLCAKAGIKSSFSELLLLHTLNHYKDASQHLVSKCLNLTPGAVSRRIDTLVQRGLAKRKEDAGNRRSNRIVLTLKGIEELTHIDKILNRGFKKPLSSITQEEMKKTCNTLEKLLTSINNNQ